MKHLRLLALVIAFALSAFASSSAFAEEGGNPTILPTPTVENPIKFNATSNVQIVFETTKGTTITCPTAKGKGEFVGQRLGKATIEFEKCKVGGVNCGTITAGLDLHLVDVLPTGTLDLGLEMLPLEGGVNKLEFKCPPFLIILLGSVIGAFDNIKGELLKSLEKGKEFKVLWKQKSAGEQEIKTCSLTKEFCFKGVEAKIFELLLDVGTGHELKAMVGDLTFTFEKEVEFHF